MVKKQTATLDVIAAADGREVIVAGEIAELHFPKGGGLSLLASKLFVQILDIAGANICDAKEHRTALEDLNWSHRDLGEIEAAVLELHRTVIQLTVKTKRGGVRKSGPILADVERDLEAATGELVFEFSKTFRHVVKNSKHWAAISRRAVFAMECKYSIWLYQLAALHAGRRQPFNDWPLADLRERLGATAPSMRRWPDFKRRVLEPAIDEINHLTGITVTWEPIKRGRQVVAVRIAADRKSAADLKIADAELDQPRAGRKTRRAGLVDLLAYEQTEIRRALVEELENLPLGKIGDKF